MDKLLFDSLVNLKEVLEAKRADADYGTDPLSDEEKEMLPLLDKLLLRELKAQAISPALS